LGYSGVGQGRRSGGLGQGWMSTSALQMGKQAWDGISRGLKLQGAQCILLFKQDMFCQNVLEGLTMQGACAVRYTLGIMGPALSTEPWGTRGLAF
jgi:hypothetical protein